MSDPNPTPDPTPDPQSDQPDPRSVPQGSRSSDGGVGPAQTAPTASTTDGGSGYAVYDTRYEKYVGGVTTKKPTKKSAAELVGHDDVEIREV